MLTSDQMGGIIRAIVPPILAWFLAKGYITSDQVAPIIAGAVAIATAAWSTYTNKPGTVIPTKGA